MKKVFRSLILALFAAVMLISVAGCADPALKEVAGTYEMTSISGTVNGVPVTMDLYEYYRIILEKNGKATVESKAKGGISYEAKATFKYEDGIIKVTSKNGGASLTEEMDYADGVITYEINQQGMNFTLRLTRVTDTDAE